MGGKYRYKINEKNIGTYSLKTSEVGKKMDFD